MPALRGLSLIENMWGLLDEHMDKLQSGTLPSKASIRTQGQAYGVAQCLALMTDPIHPDVDAVRTRAMERWEARQSGKHYAHPGDGRHRETAAELEAAVEHKRRRGITKVHPY